MYAMRTPTELPPCATCRVEPDEGNREAARIFQIVRGQVLTVGDGRPHDLNLPAVIQVMQLHGVADQRGCLEQVHKLWHHVDKARRGRKG